ncbi:c-type cytochrome [Diaphorobacter aerolatus]|uniref:Cytochrome c4 n=1 Tax=Diaphorobacter aerolatus TaxID=1288495 RepID=A0A7H0GHP6_9BURK|nr:c-type cytochrome [Diaphorobacter aerolatus]QNP47812.1 cytochrome c4 [Diaphorobacter aerolatus]
MKRTFTTIFGLAVACATGLIQAQEIKGDAKAGEGKIAMCIGCHGIVGYQATFPEVYRVPMISGQSAKYIVTALTEYKKGERKHPTMRGIADSLSEQDMADVAAFYSTHTRDAKPVPDVPPEPNAQVAQLLQKGACVSCHGANFSKTIDPSYPKLAGQHKDYLYAALRSYKTDTNPIGGRSNAIMAGMTKQFTNAELKALAGYISSLPSDLQTVPESRFR